MDGLFDPSAYGRVFAETYDEQHADLSPDEAVAFLSAHAKGGRILELGVGTGRIAIPLAARGHQVDGVDISEEMLAVLGAKPGGDAVRAILADFSELELDGRYDLVFGAYNALFFLANAQAQLRTFQGVARLLTGAGVFVIENTIPRLANSRNRQSVGINRLGNDELILDAREYDPATQRLLTQRLVIRDGVVRLYPYAMRFASHSELDMMALHAGLDLKARYANWRMDPFNRHSRGYVSVYGFARVSY